MGCPRTLHDYCLVDSLTCRRPEVISQWVCASTILLCRNIGSKLMPIYTAECREPQWKGGGPSGYYAFDALAEWVREGRVGRWGVWHAHHVQFCTSLPTFYCNIWLPMRLSSWFLNKCFFFALRLSRLIRNKWESSMRSYTVSNNRRT